MNSFTEENYLKAIYKIAENSSGNIATNDIAKRLDTTAASVTDMLKKLAKKKYIKYKKYKGLNLTDSGNKIALSIIRKHRLWEMFLVKVLKFKWDEVHEIAEQMEHIRSEKLIQHIDNVLKYPKIDPHGDPIPDVNGKMMISKEKSVQLSMVKEGKQYVVTGVVDHSKAFLQLLDKSGIILGGKLKVKAIQPYDKSLSIQLNNKKHIFISHQISKNILVSIGAGKKK